MVKEYDFVRTLIEREGFPAGTTGTVVSIYGTGPGCEVELWDEDGLTADVVTYEFSDLEIIDEYVSEDTGD